MSKPGLPNCFTSGWHLHESLRDLDSGANAFSSPTALLSETARHFIGGLIEHANASTLFAVPTVTGYKRLNDSPLCPSRAIWAHQNRAAMLRVIGAAGDPGTHVENRIGDPAANPYLFMAAQVIAGLDGIERKLDPGAPCNDDPYAQVDAPRLPVTLAEAIDVLANSALMRAAMGDHFLDYYLAMKRHEWNRFISHVTDWEQREYFEAF
jgi:glutamine synthetase